MPSFLLSRIAIFTGIRSAARVISSWLVIWKPPSPQIAHVSADGLPRAAPIAADRIPVKIAILDNKKLGMIRQWQEIVYAGNYHSSHLPGPDFVKLAEAYG